MSKDLQVRFLFPALKGDTMAEMKKELSVLDKAKLKTMAEVLIKKSREHGFDVFACLMMVKVGDESMVMTVSADVDELGTDKKSLAVNIREGAMYAVKLMTDSLDEGEYDEKTHGPN